MEKVSIEPEEAERGISAARERDLELKRELNGPRRLNKKVGEKNYNIFDENRQIWRNITFLGKRIEE